MSICILCASIFISVVLVPHIRQQQALVKRHAALRTLDYLHPNFQPLVQFISKHTPVGIEQWQEYSDYYTRITDAFPNMAEAHLIKGYCLIEMGNKQDGAKEMQQALEGNPNLFWAYYNLGVVAAESQDYARASQFFQQAISVSPQESLKNVFTSKIYFDIGAFIPNFNTFAVDSIKSEYQKAAMGAVAFKELAANPSEHAPPNFDPLFL